MEDKEGKCHVTIGPSPFDTIQKELGSKPQTVEVEKVLVCIGRKSNTANFGLEKLGVKADENGWKPVFPEFTLLETFWVLQR